MRSSLPIVATLLLCHASPVLATTPRTTGGRARAVVTRKQKAEIRRDLRSLMGYHLALYSGRNPRLHVELYPRGGGQVLVEATLVARSRNGSERQVQFGPRMGLIDLKDGGRWSWNTSTFTDVHAPRNPVKNLLTRIPFASAAEIGRRAGEARVLYSNKSSGNELRIATIDTGSGRLVGTSTNLARKAVSAARVAHRARGGNTPSNVVIGPLSTTGRSVEVEVFWPRNAGLSTDTATTYRVQLDGEGLPTGSVAAVKSRYLR